MDKQKIIKIGIGIAVAIGAIVYFIITNQNTESYEDVLTNNEVVQSTVSEQTVEEVQKIKVYVTGEVNSPGVIELEEGARIQDAIEGSGGIKPEANLKDINLAYEVSDGEKIYIPNLSEEAVESQEQGNLSTSASSTGTSSNGKVNINKATVSELTNVPGIGASTAQKIVSYRDENGKFKSVEDIKNVSGIGASKYESMKDYITVK